MHLRYTLLFFFFTGLTCNLVAQEKGFLASYSDESHSWFASDAIEITEGRFVVCAYDQWGPESILLSLSQQGEILDKVALVAQDTTLYAYRLLPVPDKSESLLLCLCHPANGSQAALSFLRIDEKLDILSKKVVPCHFLDAGDSFWDATFALSDTCLFGALTTCSEEGLPGAIFLTKFDIMGNLLISQRWERDSLNTVCNVIPMEGGHFGLFGRLDPSGMGILTFDDDLRFLGCDTLSPWDAPEGNNGDYVHNSFYDIISGQAETLPDGSLLVSARLWESLYTAHGSLLADDRSAILASYRHGFHSPENTLVAEHLNDSVEYPAFHRSLAFQKDSAEGEVFHCVILNERPQYGYFQPTPTGIVVTKADRDLNIIWKRRYLGDKNYQATVVDATSDGGCLVVGSLCHHATRKMDLFALKIDENGLLGWEEQQGEQRVTVYPNPTDSWIMIDGAEVIETAVFNSLGICVKVVHGNRIDMGELSPGVYSLKIKEDDGRNHHQVRSTTRKLIVH